MFTSLSGRDEEKNIDELNPHESEFKADKVSPHYAHRLLIIFIDSILIIQLFVRARNDDNNNNNFH
jgi:hypothetical protein